MTSHANQDNSNTCTCKTLFWKLRFQKYYTLSSTSIIVDTASVFGDIKKRRKRFYNLSIRQTENSRHGVKWAPDWYSRVRRQAAWNCGQESERLFPRLKTVIVQFLVSSFLSIFLLLKLASMQREEYLTQ